MGLIFNRPERKELRQALRNRLTTPEWKLWYHLRNKGIGFRFRRQHGIGRYVVDFYCPEKRLAIELDGDSHFQPQGKAYDTERDAYLMALGICVARFTNTEIHERIEAVLERIIRLLGRDPL